MKRIVTFLLLSSSLVLSAMHNQFIDGNEVMCESGLMKSMILWYANQAEANLTLIKEQLDAQKFNKICELIEVYKETPIDSHAMRYDMKALKILAAVSALQISDCSPLATIEARLAFFSALENYKKCPSSYSKHYEYLEERCCQGNLQTARFDNDIPNIFQYIYELHWQDYLKAHLTLQKSYPRCAISGLKISQELVIQERKEVIQYLIHVLKDTTTSNGEHTPLMLYYPVDPEGQAFPEFIKLLFTREALYNNIQEGFIDKGDNAANVHQDGTFLEIKTYSTSGEEKSIYLEFS